ncbi:BTB/POZ domain-containing protein [Colletotrichum truncatum]|uniref:BTB/POZ domain-containing protein n=1 Tax=Colletotrichum truncatum TaxID=5467 RepID=A0ACC3YCI0_COLTU|nr:BTB/POZ domain-containing protein [Colletotrichum truncatum]KAF6794083.1 BTB/POZ domain-containing protein [Colletotrichum truncatum]
MIQYFYRLDYQQPQILNHGAGLPETDQNSQVKIPSILLHARVYTLAENYAISGLKDLAITKFKTATIREWDPASFLRAAHEAYTSTIDTDRALRDTILQEFAKHKDLLDSDEAKALFGDLGSFAYDLLMYFYREGKIW